MKRLQSILCLTASFITYVATAQIADYQTFSGWSSFYITTEMVWSSSTVSEKTQNGFFAVRFEPARQCKAQISYSRPSPPISERMPDGAFSGTLELRVDRNDVWVVKDGQATIENGLSVDGTRAVYNLSFYVSLDFLSELASGDQLRMIDKNNSATERFGLAGSRAALTRSLTNCKKQIETDSTFTHPPVDKEAPSSPSKPVQTDTDKSDFKNI